MKRRSFPRVLMYLALCCTLVFMLGLMAGCKGDTGDTGPQGPQGIQGPEGPAGPGPDLTQCSTCHHLNSLELSNTGENFVAGMAGSDVTVGTSGGATSVSFVASTLTDTAVGYKWEVVGGLAATINDSSAATTTITLPVITDYKAELAKNVKTPDRTVVMPVNPESLEFATTAEVKLTVYSESGKTYYGLVYVHDGSAGAVALSGAAVVNTGIDNVPINVPVILMTKGAGPYSWSITTSPGGSSTIADATTKYPSFVPDTAGLYTLTESVSGDSVNVYAGTWRGEIIGVTGDGSSNGGNIPTPDTACTVCHNNSTAPDKFTPWKNSGHASRFADGLNEGGHYGPGCFPCHTVGFDTAASNNGFDDQPNYATFITDTSMFSATADTTRYSRMWSSASYSALAKETNIQCENCHGPQVTGSGANNSHMGVAGSPRVSLAADVCGSCHGEPQRHARFQQWQESGHGQYDTALGEGLSSTASTTLRDSCAGCHTAQGFMVLLAQLQAGNPSRTIPNNIPATIDTIEPITCAVCHDPHAQGETSGVPNTATVRVSDNTPKLPGGFMATGVGRGAMCITCHNTRNGYVSSKSDSFLHQDGDPQFGTLTSYAAPHRSAQGDVLMGYNAYFVGNGIYRSPHSLVVDTCANCHMEKTPPPALLSYALGGTNHSFTASLNICKTCHGLNQSIGPMLQQTVRSSLETLKASIESVIISRNTGTPIVSANLTESHGQPAADVVYDDLTTATVTLNTIPGVTVSDMGTDALAKAVWNYILLENDSSFGVHNPDFTFMVIGQSQYAVKSVAEP